MTELSFLVDLLLNHKLPKATRDVVAARIKEVECKSSLYTQSAASSPPPRSPQPLPSGLPPHIAAQPLSTQAALVRQMQKDGALAEPIMIAPPPEAPPPVEQIAQTPQTMAALAHRQESINAGLAGIVDKQTGRKRKW
jgi:hypothetical protein